MRIEKCLVEITGRYNVKTTTTTTKPPPPPKTTTATTTTRTNNKPKFGLFYNVTEVKTNLKTKQNKKLHPVSFCK